MIKSGKHPPDLVGDRCKKCNGSGTIVVDIGGINAEASCPDCHGTGLVKSPNACKECGGSGTVLIPFGIGNVKVEASCGHCNGSGLEPESGPAIREC